MSFRAFIFAEDSVVSFISEIFATLSYHMYYSLYLTFSLNKLRPDICTNFSLILNDDIDKIISLTIFS